MKATTSTVTPACGDVWHARTHVVRSEAAFTSTHAAACDVVCSASSWALRAARGRHAAWTRSGVRAQSGGALAEQDEALDAEEKGGVVGGERLGPPGGGFGPSPNFTALR